MKKERLRWALPAARTSAALVAALILAQGALAGRHLTGDSGALGIHEMMGTEVLTVVALVQVVLGLLAIGHNRWLLWVSIAGFSGLIVQIGMGFSDQLDIHVPLGIVLFGLYLGTSLNAKKRKETS